MEIKHGQGILRKKSKKRVVKPSLKIELGRIIDKEYWLNNISEKIIKLPFQVILEHTDNRTKGPKILLH